jgi:hypothetical protein
MALWLTAVLLAVAAVDVLPMWGRVAVGLARDMLQMTLLAWLALNLYHMHRVVVRKYMPASARRWACHSALAWLVPAALTGGVVALIYHGIGGSPADEAGFCSVDRLLAVQLILLLPTGLVLLALITLLLALYLRSDSAYDIQKHRVTERPPLLPTALFSLLAGFGFVGDVTWRGKAENELGLRDADHFLILSLSILPPNASPHRRLSATVLSRRTPSPCLQGEAAYWCRHFSFSCSWLSSSQGLEVRKGGRRRSRCQTRTRTSCQPPDGILDWQPKTCTPQPALS